MSKCPQCGADMMFSPCCGRAAALAGRESEFERAVGDLVDAKAWHALEHMIAERRRLRGQSDPSQNPPRT